MATRPGDWSALGLHGDPTPGDPATLSVIADAMRELATSAGTINTGLHELQNTAGDGRRFIGKTADALRGMVDEHLQRFVGRVEESFHTAENAIRTYSTVVTNAQAEADQALSAAQGLPQGDSQLPSLTRRANDAKSEVTGAATELRRQLHTAGELMVQPVSDCDLFWEVFQWLTIILSVIAVFTGGILAVLAWGMNAVLLIKTIVAFSQGKASGLELGLAFLGVLFPTTKGINVGALIKGLGNSLKGGVSGLVGAGRNIWSQIGHFSSMTGLPKFVVAPMVIVSHLGPALTIDVAGLLRGIGNGARGGWNQAVTAIGHDWVRFTGNVTGEWAKAGTYAAVNIQRLGRLGVAAFLPLNATELGVLGFGGAARLAFGERVLGIPHPELHELLVNAGRTDAALHFGSPLANGGHGALVPSSLVTPGGVHFSAGTFSPGSSLGAVFRPGGGFGSAGTANLVHLSLGSLPTINLGSLGPGSLGIARGALPDGIHATGGGLSVPASVSVSPGSGALGLGALHGFGTPSVVGHAGGAPGLHVTGTGTALPRGLSVGAPSLLTPAVPHGMTTLPGGLSVPLTHGSGISAGAQLVHQADHAAGQVRMDSNLLLPGHTAIDLLRDAHGSSPVLHTGQPIAGLHAGTTTNVPHTVGMGEGVTLARGAVGHAEALNDLIFPELRAMAAGDVAVTGIRADGITLRLGDAAPRTVDAHAVAATAPIGPAPVGHLTGVPSATPQPVHAPAVAGAATPIPHLGGTGGSEHALTVNAPQGGAHPVSAGAVERPVTPPRSTAAAPGSTPVPRPLSAPVRVPEPVLSTHDLAMNLLRGDDAALPVPAGLSAHAGAPAGVSARPALDAAGAGHTGSANGALDLVARPGGPARADDVPAAGTPQPSAAGTPVPHLPVSKGKGKGKAPAALPPLVTVAPGGRFGGHAAAAVMNQRIHAARQIVIGGSSGSEAVGKLNAWARYERSMTKLAKAEQQLDRVTPPPGTGASTGPTAAHLAALDGVSRAGAVVDRAEDTLHGLGIDPRATRQEIRSVTGRIFTDRGGLLGGAPATRPRPPRPPAGAGHAAAPAPHVPHTTVDDAMQIDPPATGHAAGAPAPHTAPHTAPHPAGQDVTMSPPPHRGDDAMQIDPAPAPTGGAHTWTPQAGAAADPHTAVNDAFLHLGGHGAQPMNADRYAALVHASVEDSRPIAYVVNAIVNHRELGGLGAFLNSVTHNLTGFDGRIAVVIGVNGPRSELPAIRAAIDNALGGASFPHPLAMVATPVPGGPKFAYGTARNATMTSAASTHLAQTMIDRGTHPYFSIMDFDAHPHTVPGGEHVFRHFDEALGAHGSPGFPPLRPLMMSGGYRMPDLSAAGATEDLLKATNDRLAGAVKKPPKPPKPAAGGAVRKPRVVKDKGDVTADFLPTLDARIRLDMRVRDRLGGTHPQLPYSPEPNLFVDAAAVMLHEPGLPPVRFGNAGAEFQALSERLNQLNAWELDRNLPLPAFGGAGPTRLPEILGRIDDAFHADRPPLSGPESAEAQLVLHDLANAVRNGDPLVRMFDVNRVPLVLNRIGEALRNGFELHTAPLTLSREARQILWRTGEALDTRLTLRGINAANHVLPERGTAFLTDFQGGAIPTDVSRLLKDLWKDGTLPQDHAHMKKPLDRLFNSDASGGNAQAGRSGLELSSHRDDWITKNYSKLPPNPNNGRPFDPLWPVRHNPGELPRTTTSADLARDLDSRLGTPGEHPVGTAVSTPVQGSGPAVWAGINPDELRLVSHSLALSTDITHFLRHLRYFAHEHLPTRAIDLSPGSLFAALDHAAGTTSGLDPAAMLQRAFDTIDSGAGVSAATAMKRLKAFTDNLNTSGLGVEDFFVRLVTGRIHPPTDTLQGLRAAGDEAHFAMDAGSLHVLGHYATALGRDIRVTGGDGVTHFIAGPTGGKRARGSLEITWRGEPDGGGGWTVHLSDRSGSPSPAHGDGPPSGRGPDGPGSGPPKRRRTVDPVTGGKGKDKATASSAPAPVPAAPPAPPRAAVEAAWDAYAEATGELGAAQRALTGVQRPAAYGGAGSSSVSTASAHAYGQAQDRMRRAAAALNRAEFALERLGIDLRNAMEGLTLDPGRHHSHPPSGDTP
ncbi:sugar-binding protein [Streptomyces sp. H10-C2]|uniref:putative T7SS-secreted protein n=1 Tax=unclassified Streptomyces TaxID=2593676 RepID=UPI0024BB9AE7|nr:MULTISPECIES: sugar-binding protein [unclassified Streptomyces]MDJ0343354.1 sugar-binding protein [Streptomyces sp. PH10-H1]MDJ0371835.1 sugar-binding protein [Streptomyces sp. H10-C2]